MAYVTGGNKGSGMDISEPGWWALAVAAISGFVGWRVATAKDNVRLEMMAREQDAIRDRLRALEGGSTSTVAALATLSAQIDGIGRTLTRLEAALKDKADKT